MEKKLLFFFCSGDQKFRKVHIFFELGLSEIRKNPLEISSQSIIVLYGSDFPFVEQTFSSNVKNYKWMQLCTLNVVSIT